MSRLKWIAVLLVCTPLVAASYWPTTNDADVEAGQKAYRAGNFKAAAQHFRKALRGEGDSDRLQFDLGTALLRGALEESVPGERDRALNLAVASLRSATDSKQASLREKALYNLGSALVLRGSYDEAIEAYRELLRGNPRHDDARHNLELALLAKRARVSVEAPSEARSGGDPEDEGGDERAAGDGPGESDRGAEEGPDGRRGRSEREEQSSGKDREQEEAPSGEGAAPASKKTPKSLQDLDILQKLEALERRSGELRRRNLLDKTRARVRSPDKPGSDQ